MSNDTKRDDQAQPRESNPFQGGSDRGHLNPVAGAAQGGGNDDGGDAPRLQAGEEGEVGQFTGLGQPARQMR